MTRLCTPHLIFEIDLAYLFADAIIFTKTVKFTDTLLENQSTRTTSNEIVN